MIGSEQNNVLTNRIKSNFNSNGWASAYTNSFNAFARLRQDAVMEYSGVSDTTIIVTLVLMGVIMSTVIVFAVYSSILKRH